MNSIQLSILAVKIIGILLSSAGVVGASRLNIWEMKIRESLGVGKVRGLAEKISEKLSDFLNIIITGFVALLNFFTTRCLGCLFKVIGVIGSIWLFVYLISIKNSDTIGVIFSTALASVAIAFFLWIILNVNSNEDSPIKKVADFFLLLAIGLTTILLFIPMAIVGFIGSLFSGESGENASDILLKPVSWLLETLIVVLAFIIRLVITIFLRLLIAPYTLLDLFVQKQKWESTLIVIGVIVTVLSEVLGTLFK